MSNLLDKASIILTPTAYDNGKALCVKPSDGSGDFDFSRNSAATRVNAQGLVENVQILSSNLVQNGDFSEEGSEEVSNGSFSQEGVQLVTNGSFATDTNWTKQTGWSISGGSANCDGTQTANSLIYQSGVFASADSFKCEITISNYQSGVLRFVLGGGGSEQSYSANGTYTFYGTKGSDNNLYLSANSDFIGSIDNVSVREVGQNWTLGTGWSIGEDKAVFDGVSNANLTQSNILTNGKQYKLTYQILENTTTSGYIRLGAETATEITQLDGAVGTHEMYFLNDGYTTSFVIRTNSLTGGDFSITNISVKEVGQNWTLTNSWSIGSSVITTDGTINNRFYQNAVTTIGKTYKYSFDVLDSGIGVIEARFRIGNSMVLNFSSEGTYTGTFVAPDTRADFTTLSGNTASFSITNISVIEITDDTNLPRINYEGFSYQDALGSEKIVNGDFSNGSTDWSLTRGNVINDELVFNTTGAPSGSRSVFAIQNNVADLTKVYKVQFTISNYVSGQFRLRKPFITNDTFGNGTYTYYGTASEINFELQGRLDIEHKFTITNVSVKEYLGQEVVPDSGCGSWLWEPQSTNLITYSEDFSDASWVNSNSTDTSNYGISPDGLNNSTRFLTTANTGSFLYINSLPILDATNYTLSFWVKSNGNSLDKFRLYTTTGGTSLEFTSTNKWVRYEYNFLSTGTTTNLGIRGVVSQETDIQIWGAQLEQQSYATSYIPTEGSTNTRNQDLCYNGATGTGLINSTEGVLYAEIAALSNDGTNRVISISDGTTVNRVSIVLGSGTNEIRGQVLSSGTSFDFSATSYNTLNNNKIAISYKLNDFSMWINGTKVSADTSGNIPVGMNTISFNAGGTILTFFGKTKALAVWKEALSDQELIKLTTI